MDVVVWAQEAVFIYICIIVIVVDCLGQVSCRRCKLGRAPRTKETLPKFSEVESGNLISTCIPRVDGWSTDPRKMGRHNYDNCGNVGIQAFPLV